MSDDPVADLARVLAGISAPSVEEWVPALRRALDAGFETAWLRDNATALGPAALHAACNARIRDALG